MRIRGGLSTSDEFADERGEPLFVCVSFYVHVPVRADGTPGVLGRDILYKALAALDRPQKDQTVIDPPGEPCLFAHGLNIFIARDRIADMLFVRVFLCDAYVFHTYYIVMMRQNLQAMKKIIKQNSESSGIYIWTEVSE